ncbi:hypothetical protein AM500_08015 [Bacillus sp. FJAT-18017]|nr:hypothetical protein AM500_08015 [Bacillus sp. FJAT-18017]
MDWHRSINSNRYSFKDLYTIKSVMTLGSNARGDGGLNRFNDKLRLGENKKVQITVEAHQ